MSVSIKTSASALCTLILVSALAACGGSSAPSAAGGDNGGGGGDTVGRKFLIQPGPNATGDMVAAMVQAAPGDVIEFDCGFFDLSSTLQLINTEDVRVKGCGMDQTVLSFKNSNTPEGVLAVNVRGLTISDLTVLDTGGNGIEFRGVDHGTVSRVRAIWSSGGGRFSETPITAENYPDKLQVACTQPATLDPNQPENTGNPASESPDYTVSKLSGRYGVYPVASENILIENSESIGASDAGIYVGQTNNAIIRNSRSAFNVFGMEIENVRGGEYADNIAECNTGGFLIYDLDGLRQYGDRSTMHGNISRMNNTYNFTAGGFVGNVPSGSGMITLAYDQIDIYDNTFENNNTAGIIHTSYAIFPPGDRPSDMRIDFYTEGLHIFRNVFKNNGNGLPAPTTQDLQEQNLTHLLPALVGAKVAAGCALPTNAVTCAQQGGNGPRGGHIIWDGLLDTYNADCAYPKDANGNPVPADARGKPILTNEVPNPDCHYNAYKFDTSASGAPRIYPDWYSCIDADNEFSNDSIHYANFHGTRGLEAVITNDLDPQALAEFPADFDMSSHNCVAQYGKNLPQLPEVMIPPFQRSGTVDPAPTAEEIAAKCNASVAAGAVNFGAASVNCPTLDSYHLFSDPQDPASAPNGSGVPFVLNSKLFSDYAVKYRVMYLPPGTTAVYRDADTGGTNATMMFPAGTIVAKTFSFSDEDADVETPVETRLLIKRVNSSGQVRWDGLPYIWETSTDGKKIARLKLGGGQQQVSWNFTDVDSGASQSGSTMYSIPNANQCISCHANEDVETGAAPIGPKIRNLNRPYRSESHFVTGQSQHEVFGQNQIKYLCDQGLMIGCPQDLQVDPTTQIAAAAERLPTYNKPGDSGFAAGSAEDVEARARAYLEVNCAHCHNVRGFAASTGFYLDAFRPVDGTYGICKRPTATGQEGNGGRVYDIHPGDETDSIVVFRTGPEAQTPAARMPPIARSVAHTEGNALLAQWIRDVVTADDSKYPGSESCAGGGPGLP